ncbi:putative carboxypeptidase S1 [Polychaeton citri CBS 116435]|uniref:Carboxypeptidase S1 n=1 Tax=Polychaeton citri CBS 116435 TaxID=1314669 RepID=A0A9P4UP57_9PEZI|nr:putative carboxypeptidase S1 [Polychaeton citri CBS 116435]
MYLIKSAVLLGLATSSFAFYNPPTPKDTFVKDIPSHPGLSIEYKQTAICETTAKAWAGYVHMPSTYLEDVVGNNPYNVSMFFWYFEARNNPTTAPTAVWLAGGPGVASTLSAGSENGPCNVLSDSNSTEANPWSLNVHSNVLYIDQPVGAGFSYNSLVNSTYDMLAFYVSGGMDAGITPVSTYNDDIPGPNATFLHGLLPDQNPAHSPNNTVFAARTLWHFSQAWFGNFPEYKTKDKSIGIWGNSYGGYWVPRTAALFLQQNAKIASRKLTGVKLPVKTIGITNGCVDVLYQADYYADMAYNNTYGFQAVPQAVYEEMKNNYTKPGGCRDQIQTCRDLGVKLDPLETSSNEEVNSACLSAQAYCFANVNIAFDVLSDRSDFDIAHTKPDPFPSSYADGFFNQDWVIREMGARVNFTATSLVDTNIFLGLTADPFRRAGMLDVEYLLKHKVNIALAYGDRDYRCPWIGAEALSLAANWTGAKAFRNAGYEYVTTNSSYQGGVVRQHGGLSFTRIFQSGHDVSVYQPETTYQIFNRAMFGKDIATGRKLATGDSCGYSSKGPSSSFGIKQKLPPVPPVECYIYNGDSCTESQLSALQDGSAVIENFIVVKPDGSQG